MPVTDKNPQEEKNNSYSPRAKLNMVILLNKKKTKMLINMRYVNEVAVEK